MRQKLQLISSVAGLYIATIGTVGYLALPAPSPARAVSKISSSPPKPASPRFVVVSGKPVRIVIPDSNIDLPIDEGIYAEDDSWTLSDTHAQFAVMSALANNHAGNTFIYGHGTDEVFGRIGNKTPAAGTLARIYTDNGNVFSYRFEESHNLTPDETDLLSDTKSGAPRLTLQTCTGVWSEWRTIFVFAFEKVEEKT